MSLQQQIEQKLAEALPCTHIEVINESGKHNVPPGSESHFKVVVVSDDFLDKKLVSRHRMINAILARELAEGVHALAIHTYSDSEWQRKSASAPASPDCHGGG
jgi:BolA protein